MCGIQCLINMKISAAFDGPPRRLRLMRTLSPSNIEQSPARVCAHLQIRSLEYLEVVDAADTVSSFSIRHLDAWQFIRDLR